MIAGLPWESWLLLLAAVGPGLAIELVFYLSHRTPPTAAESGGRAPEDRR